MGVIQRQSIKNTIVSYVGVLIAIFSTLFIYKLDEEIYGFAQFIYSSAFFLTPFASLGVVACALKFYPSYSEHKERFLNSLLLLLMVISVVFIAVFLLAANPIYALLESSGVDEQGVIRQYSWVILPIAIILNVNILLTSQAANMRRIVIPELINNLGYKVVLPCIIILAYLGFVNRLEVAIAILIFFLIVLILMLAYLMSLKAINIKAGILHSVTTAQKTEFGKYVLFSGLNNMGSSLALRIDVIMVTTIIGFEAAGIYGIIMFLANVIEIPRKAINKIAAPIISEAWTKNDYAELKLIYKKSSINLLLVGIPIFLAIWFSLPFLDIISAGEDRFVIAKYVFLFLGLGKLFDMLMSVNSELIIYSEKYKYNLLFLILLGLFNVALNIYLIKAHGIVGAALATCIAYFIFNVVKFLFIWWSYKLQPFSRKSVLLILIGVALFCLVTYLPFPIHLWYGPLLQVILVGLLYIPLVIWLNISPDVNGMLKDLWNTRRK